MKVLLVGGAGRVGTFVTPYLKQRHQLRALDLRPPRDADVEYVQGSVTDPAALRRALEGVDAFIWMVMRKPQGGSVTTQDYETILENYEVNTKALHLLLYVAQELGVMRGVYTSTMSVHYRRRALMGGPQGGQRRYESEELTALDTPSVYGLSKGFGELICQYFARWFGMNLVALRITGPRERENYLKERRAAPADKVTNGDYVFPTDEEDLANAYLAALEAVQTGHGRFDAVFIAGDEEELVHNLSKARRVLGWRPESHRYLE